MVTPVRSMTFVLVALMFVSEAFTRDSIINPDIEPYTEEELAELVPYLTNDEYIRQVHSMIDAHKADVLGGRMVIETNALIDTKYKTWKRNADLINSILALPKGMNDAGR
ncbi:pigment-dispersing factor [Anticarsia gemmatalis]|uniref:pigment-dispersing factor n=1 Tax=Anticarsia gemmatalis TaxID=129554 RepID=UPI003F7715F2